jgi:hypothetical protein
MVLEDGQKIGIGLICLGIGFISVGVLMMLDSAMIAIGPSFLPSPRTISSFVTSSSTHRQHSLPLWFIFFHWSYQNHKPLYSHRSHSWHNLFLSWRHFGSVEMEPRGDDFGRLWFSQSLRKFPSHGVRVCSTDSRPLSCSRCTHSRADC